MGKGGKGRRMFFIGKYFILSLRDIRGRCHPKPFLPTKEREGKRVVTATRESTISTVV